MSAFKSVMRSMSTAVAALTLSVGVLAQSALVEGEVRKVDAPAGKITLKHAAIANLKVPAMTMIFSVKDAAWLTRFHAGDKVRFTADKIDGQYTVTAIEPAQ